jgi:hypothetical protein
MLMNLKYTWLSRTLLCIQTRVVYSSQCEQPAVKRYTETILLPKTNFQAKITGKKRIDKDQYLQDVRKIFFLFIISLFHINVIFLSLQNYMLYFICKNTLHINNYLIYCHKTFRI